MTRTSSPPANACHSDETKTRAIEKKKTCTEGTKWYAHHYSRVKKMGGTVTCEAFRWKVHAYAKPKESGNSKFEISAAKVMCTMVPRSIRSGTFGTCYLGKYWGIDVVIKTI